MHPPFHFTDHKVGPDPFVGTVKPRRSKPARLDLTPASTGWPPVPLVPRGPIDPAIPPGLSGPAPVRLWIVPPPRRGWKDVVGRWMIRTGQRMILGN